MKKLVCAAAGVSAQQGPPPALVVTEPVRRETGRRGASGRVIGGLALSTVFTLVLVPSLFSLAVETRARLAGAMRR